MCSTANAYSSRARLPRIVREFPALKVVVEHITTAEAADFVAAASANVAATITPQHLLYSRSALFAGGVRPHLYCLPVLKREAHRQAIVRAATSGNPKYFLGTDSAPHAQAYEGKLLLRGRLLLGTCSARALRRGIRRRRRARSARGIRELSRRRFLRIAAQTRTRSRCAARHGRSRTEYALGESTVVPLRAGENVRWRVLS